MTDILMSSRVKMNPVTVFDTTPFTVIHGAFETVSLPQKVDGIFFDTPGISPEISLEMYTSWTHMIFDHIDSLVAPDAALILIPRDQKGGGFLKSVATAYVAMSHGWSVFRNYMWDKGPDFHRAHYVFQNVYVFRRGNMPTRIDAPLRFKDIVRVPDLSITREGTVAELPSIIPEMFLGLFDLKVVLDPFAGSGSVAEACYNLQTPKCYSVELDLDRVEEIVRRIASLPWKVSLTQTNYHKQ